LRTLYEDTTSRGEASVGAAPLLLCCPLQLPKKFWHSEEEEEREERKKEFGKKRREKEEKEK